MKCIENHGPERPKTVNMIPQHLLDGLARMLVQIFMFSTGSPGITLNLHNIADILTMSIM